VGYDRPTAAGKRFNAQIAALAKMELRVGFNESKAGYGFNHEAVAADDYEDGPAVAEVAAWNELGTPGTPPRPFMRQSIDNNTGRIKTMCSLQLQELVNGVKTADEIMRAIGALQVGLIQHEIRSGGFAANAPATIKRKKSDKPLIDTGHMRQSVHYVIKQKGG
jgi:hypothetical protein